MLLLLFKTLTWTFCFIFLFWLRSHIVPNCIQHQQYVTSTDRYVANRFSSITRRFNGCNICILSVVSKLWSTVMRNCYFVFITSTTCSSSSLSLNFSTESLMQRIGFFPPFFVSYANALLYGLKVSSSTLLLGRELDLARFVLFLVYIGTYSLTKFPWRDGMREREKEGRSVWNTYTYTYGCCVSLLHVFSPHHLSRLAFDTMELLTAYCRCY